MRNLPTYAVSAHSPTTGAIPFPPGVNSQIEIAISASRAGTPSSTSDRRESDPMDNTKKDSGRARKRPRPAVTRRGLEAQPQSRPAQVKPVDASSAPAREGGPAGERLRQFEESRKPRRPEPTQEKGEEGGERE